MAELKIYPVIHHVSREISLHEFALARAAGADGAFLISHDGHDADVCNVAWEAKQSHQDWRIGINLLSKPAHYAANQAIELELDMVWADDMGVNSQGLNARGQVLQVLAGAYSRVEFFASVAFKYQALESNPSLAATQALTAGFTPTTSGVGTGSAPELQKIVSMSRATKGHLAIASGMTPENVAQFAPHLSRILVATGVGLDEFRIDKAKLVALIAAARQARVIPPPQ